MTVNHMEENMQHELETAAVFRVEEVRGLRIRV